MGDDTKRLSPGDLWRPTADTLNGYQEAADFIRNLQSGGGAIPGSGLDANSCVISVRNLSGVDRSRFEVLGIDRPIVEPGENLETFKSRPAFNGVLPTIKKHAGGRWVVLIRPALAGAMTRAVIAGVVQVRVYVNSAADEYCDIIERKTIGDEDCYLGSGSTGAQILWKEDGEDTIVWAVVRLGASSLTLFEIQDAWSLEPVLDIADAPASWAHTTGKRVRYHSDTRNWSTNDGDKTEYLWHSAGYLPGQDPDTGNWTANDELTLGVFYPRFSVGDWVWCVRDPASGFWQVVESYKDVIRVKLIQDLYECGRARGYVIVKGEHPSEVIPVVVFDRLGLVSSSLLAVSGTDGRLRIPAGMCAYAKYFADTKSWEVFAFGHCRCGGSSSSSMSSSSDSYSGSSSKSGTSSGSNSSDSGSSSPSGSQSDSGSSESGGSGGSSGGSDKSTAIVPASWTTTGYTALFIAECPEVRFDDVMVVKIAKVNMYLPIDPKFLEVCEANSVQVCGCVTDIPVLVGAVVEGDKVRVQFVDENPNLSLQVVIRLTGIRKGFRGLRFPSRTKAQFEANERFIRSAYPSR